MKLSTMNRARNLLLISVFSVTAMFTTSCGEGGESKLSIPGVDGPTVTLQNDDLLISMVFENIQLQGGLRYAIPKYNNSYIEVSPDLQSDGTLMSVSVSLDDIFGDRVTQLPAQSLPGGRALPGVASGSLPAVAFSIPKWKNMAFYVGPKVFGIFVPTKLDIGTDNIITAAYRVSERRMGNLSMVGPDAQGENSGFLLLLNVSRAVENKLKRVAKSN